MNIDDIKTCGEAIQYLSSEYPVGTIFVFDDSWGFVYVGFVVEATDKTWKFIFQYHFDADAHSDVDYTTPTTPSFLDPSYNYRFKNSGPEGAILDPDRDWMRNLTKIV